MLTIILLAVATAATGTCVHLWIENARLRAERNDLLRKNTLLVDFSQGILQRKPVLKSLR